MVLLRPGRPVRTDIPLLAVTQRLRNDTILVGAGSDPGTQRCTGWKIRMAARHSLLLEQDLDSLHQRLPEEGDDPDITTTAERGGASSTANRSRRTIGTTYHE